MSAREAKQDQGAQRAANEQAGQDAGAGPLGKVRQSFSFGVGQMRAAVFEARIGADLFAAGKFQRFLGEGMAGQRGGIAFLGVLFEIL